eukprot:6734862-Alexandrium_andersonii.AAC.1
MRRSAAFTSPWQAWAQTARLARSRLRRTRLGGQLPTSLASCQGARAVVTACRCRCALSPC